MPEQHSNTRLDDLQESFRRRPGFHPAELGELEGELAAMNPEVSQLPPFSKLRPHVSRV